MESCQHVVLPPLYGLSSTAHSAARSSPMKCYSMGGQLGLVWKFSLLTLLPAHAGSTVMLRGHRLPRNTQDTCTYSAKAWMLLHEPPLPCNLPDSSK